MAPTSSWTHPFKSHLTTTSRSSIGCTFRALVHSESGLEYCLRNLPQPFVAEFRAHNSRGRAAEEQGDCKAAEDSFLQCRNMIMALREGLDDPLGSVVHNSLLAWANLFLAQLYQSVGTPDTLKTAMELRDEILDCVLPLESSGADPDLVDVCEIYYCTSRYELGDALGSSEETNGAIQSYSEVMSCSEDAAAAQICFLLCLDHMCLGRFKEGLRWIREANRVRKKQSANWNGCKFFFLEYEAALLMKLERFSEAVEALEDLTQSPEYHHDRKVHTMFLQCYSEMSRRAVDVQDVQRAEEYKNLAREQQSLIQSLLQKGTLRHCQVLFPNMAFAHPLMMPTTSPLGISGYVIIGTVPLHKESFDDQCLLKGGVAMGFSQRLGCTQAHEWRDSDLHLKKFPNAMTWMLIFQIEKEQEARKQHDWETSIFESEQTRGLLELAKGFVDTETHCWLLAWVDLPLASLYHFHARSLAKALTIRKEIQKCTAVPAEASSRASLKDYHIPFAALEYELSCSTTSKYEIIQKWARTYRTDEKRAERDLCFWLYYGYRLHENFEEALKWLLEAKRLREDHDSCLRKMGPRIDYFCCDYDYNRCEVELFTKLGMDDKAKNAMESLRNTKHNEHNGLMEVDFEQVNKSAEGQLRADSTPTASDRIAIKESNRSDVIEKLMQSPIDSEHHLLKLPFPIQLALRKHSYLGRLYDVEHADWENAIFQYEWCQELLNTVIQLNSEFRGAYNWLMTWIAVPLASLYQYKTKNNYKKALDLRMLMVEWVTRSDHKTLIGYSKFEVYVAAYLCAISDYPHDPDVRNQVVASAAAMLQVKDEWSLESLLIRKVTRDLMVVYENYEGGLLFIRRAMQLVERRFQEPAFKSTDDYVDFLLWEVIGLRHLRRPDEVKTVLENYWRSSGKSKPELPKVVQQLLGASMEDFNHGENFEDFIWQYDEAIGLPSGEALELSQKMRECCLEREYAKAISYLEEFLKLIEENPKPEGQEHDEDIRLTFISNARIASLYTIMFAQTPKVSTTQPPKAEFGQDGNFLHALEYYKKCLSQLTTEEEIFSMFRSNLIASILLRLIILCFLAWDQFDILLHFNSMLNKKIFNDQVNYSEQDDDAFCDRLERILEFMEQLPVQKYAHRLIMQHTRSLHTVGSKHYTEGWIEWLEDYKFVYSFLQRHHRLRGYLIMGWIQIKSDVNPKSAVNPEALKIFTESEVDISWWSAFLYAEKERTQVMLYQHEIHRRNSLGISVQPWSFDAHDNSGLQSIKESCRALLTRESSVFVQYSPVANSIGDTDFYSIYVLVIDQDRGCELFVEETPPVHHDDAKPTIDEKRLKNFYAYLAYKTKHPNHNEICHLDKKYRSLLKSSTITDDESMNKYLEFLYDVLIRPIAHHLDKMKREDKLVLAPCELLTQVPFAALRNRNDQKYLIESHAMAIAPSLRVLQMCSERAHALQTRSGHGRGSILALGDPTYDCDECIENNRLPLKATAKEVDHIASVFREADVVTLTGKNATTKNLLEWAAKLSQERLAIVHVGAHGVIDKERNYRNSHLQLACDPSLSSANSAATSASGHQASEAIMSSRRGKPDDEQIDEDASDSEVEDDATIGRSTLSRIMGSRFITNTDATTGDGASGRGGKVRLKRNGGACALAHDLTVERIQSLEQLLSAELLVLSACQTSAGRTTTEGVLSLARAFMAMGVPCVVASLWKVDDDATFSLMKDLYDDLRAGNDVACAMQSATLHSMARHGRNAVQYWAPFNVWGAPSLCIPKELQHQVLPSSDSSSSHGKSKS